MVHPAGIFDAIVLDHGLDEGDTGTPFAWAKFKTDHGNITGFFYLSERAAEYSAQKIDAMGFTGMRLEDFNTEPPSCRGNKCEIVVNNEMYDGKERAKVAFVNKPGGGGVQLNKSAKVAASVGALNGLLAKVRKESGTQADAAGAAGAASDESPYDDDSDIPF